MSFKYPCASEVAVTDSTLGKYLNTIRYFTLPCVFEKLEDGGCLQNYLSILNRDGGKHIGPAFSDAMLLHTLTAACNFLIGHRDCFLEAYVEKVVNVITDAAGCTDGFLSTATLQNYPENRWGRKGGDIVIQYDLYNHGALIEAGISYYNATYKMTLLKVAIRAANLMCRTIGHTPKKNVVPGHSLVESSLVKLYTVFRDDTLLNRYAQCEGIDYKKYLDLAEFFYEARGNYKSRSVSCRFNRLYNQDHITFAEQRKAVGDAHRGTMCYAGATAVADQTLNNGYYDALDSLWKDVYTNKYTDKGILTIPETGEFAEDDGGIPDICATLGFAVWSAQMNLHDINSKYYDVYENVLRNIAMPRINEKADGFDFEGFSDKNIELAMPLITKFFSAVCCYIYAYSANSLNVNLLIDSVYKNEVFEIEQKNKEIHFDTKGQLYTLRIRIPDYAENFMLNLNGKEVDYMVENGYAVISGVFDYNKTISFCYDNANKKELEFA